MKELEYQTTPTLWGQKYKGFQPPIIGEGDNIYQVYSVGQRPYYWIVKTDIILNEEDESYDEIMCMIEDEYGYNDEEGDYDFPVPNFDCGVAIFNLKETEYNG